LSAITTFDARAVGPADHELLWEIFRSSRAGPLADLPESLLRMQHRARELAYAADRATDDRLLLVDGRPAGRLLVWRTALEHRVVDIAMLPQYRRRGLGTLVLRALIREAEEAAKPLRLTVAADNQGALELYQRLGFAVSAWDTINVSMEIAAPGTYAGC